MIDQEKLTVLAGPPGTGKTTALLGEVEAALEAGVAPDRIGYLSFTKRAVEEAVDRACQRFRLRPRMLPYFRTLHSLAFSQLGMTRTQVMGREHFKELGEMLGLQLSGITFADEGLLQGQTKDDRLVFLENMARVRCVPLRQVWKEFAHDDVDWWQLERLSRAMAEYKVARCILDYTDMISRYIEKDSSTKLELLVVDEAQDLSEIQWRMVELLAREAETVVVGGDDDQAIYQWAGASVDRFIGLRGGRHSRVLGQSYRVPRRVHDLADQVIRCVSVRRDKTWRARDVEGGVDWYSHPSHVDMGSGSWLVLARNNYLLKEVEDECRYRGYWFETKGKTPVALKLISEIVAHEKGRQGGSGAAVWYEAFSDLTVEHREYIRSMLRRGEKLTKQPRIRLSTIHGAKGAEADNVMLLTDMSLKAHQQLQRNPDDELRVQYVALTRAKEKLHLVAPSTNLNFGL